MNVENFFRLIQALEQDELVADGIYFDMNNWFRCKTPIPVTSKATGITYDCGTAACLAGHARTLSGIENPNNNTFPIAQKWLGLDYATARRLFEPHVTEGIKLEDITKEWAIAVMLHFLDTGLVRYRENCPEGLVYREWSMYNA